MGQMSQIRLIAKLRPGWGQAVQVGRAGHAGFAHAVVAAHVIPVPVFLVGQVVQATVDGYVMGDLVEAGQVDDAEARGLERAVGAVAVGCEEGGAVDAVLFLDQGPADQGAVVLLVVTEAEYALERVDAVQRFAIVVIAPVGVGNRALGVQALRCAKTRRGSSGLWPPRP